MEAFLRYLKQTKMTFKWLCLSALKVSVPFKSPVLDYATCSFSMIVMDYVKYPERFIRSSYSMPLVFFPHLTEHKSTGTCVGILCSLKHETEQLKASHLFTGRTWALCPRNQKTSPPVHFLVSPQSGWRKCRRDTAPPSPSGSHRWPNLPPKSERKKTDRREMWG